jgi:hypothetical protein
MAAQAGRGPHDTHPFPLDKGYRCLVLGFTYRGDPGCFEQCAASKRSWLRPDEQVAEGQRVEAHLEHAVNGVMRSFNHRVTAALNEVFRMSGTPVSAWKWLMRSW